MNWYFKVLKKYAVFGGRARRKEYWFFVLFSVIITIVLVIVDSMIGRFDSESGLGLLSGIYSLAVFIPSVAVLVRRLHDTSRSGWWLLIALVWHKRPLNRRTCKLFDPGYGCPCSTRRRYSQLSTLVMNEAGQ